MSNDRNKLKRKLFNAEEALNIIISEEYSFGTSSSDDSSSQSSDYDETSDTNSQSPESPSPKRIKLNNFEKNTCKKNTVDEHGKFHIADRSDTHNRPTLNAATLLPEATKKSDTASSLDPNISHDKSDENHSPHIGTQQTDLPSQPTEEFVLSIPIDIKTQDIHNEQTVFLQQQEVNPNPDEIEFPPEYLTNLQNRLTNFDHDSDYIIETENIQKPQRVEYPYHKSFKRYSSSGRYW